MSTLSALPQIQSLVYIARIQPRHPQNGLANSFQHALGIAEPSLAVVGQIHALLFYAYEYQDIAVALVLAGRCALPSTAEQKE